jgi:predicted phosphoadenosine phosphosulfate sulfurtransferase
VNAEKTDKNAYLIARTQASWFEASQLIIGLRANRSLARQRGPWLNNRSRLYHPQEWHTQSSVSSPTARIFFTQLPA